MAKGNLKKIDLLRKRRDADYLAEPFFIDTKKYINNKIANLFNKTDLSGKDLINAGRRQEQTNNNWEVSLSFSNEGAEKFAA